MATHVSYNGIRLYNVNTREFSQETMYDQSNTDMIGSKFTLRVEGVIHLQTVFADAGIPWVAPLGVWTDQYQQPQAGVIQPSAFNNSVSDLARMVRARLSKPRGVLEVWIDNTQLLLLCGPANLAWINHPDRDISNGPHPVSVRLDQIAGHSLFRVSFAITCDKLECWSTNPLPPILSNRWAVSESIDQNWYTTKTITGTIRLSAGSLSEIKVQDAGSSNPRQIINGYTPEIYRALVVPWLEVGFRREQFEFSVSKDGLSADYSIIDRQVHYSAPWPATDMQMQHDESSNNGITWIGSVDIELTGPPHIDKRLLLSRLIDLADEKLKIRTGNMTATGKNSFILQNAVISDYIGAENRVRGRFQVRRAIGDPSDNTQVTAKLVVGVLEKMMCTPIKSLPQQPGQPPTAPTSGYDPRYSTGPQTWGYDPHMAARSPAVLIAMQCYLQDPCVNCHENASNLRSLVPEPGGRSSYNTTNVVHNPSYSTGNLESQKYQGNVNYSAAQAIYTSAQIENRYTTQQMRVQMPIARAADDGTSATSLIAKLGPAQAQREIIYDATRVGTWPAIPNPEKEIFMQGKSANIIGTLLSKEFAFQPPTNTPDATNRLYHLRARYVYALSRPPSDQDKLNINAQPFMVDKSTDDLVRITIQEIVDENMTSGDVPETGIEDELDDIL